jgi:hypothetical protein
MAPAMAAVSSSHRLISAWTASALTATMRVEPGTTVPTIGIASENASRKTAQAAYCGCRETKAVMSAR